MPPRRASGRLGYGPLGENQLCYAAHGSATRSLGRIGDILSAPEPIFEVPVLARLTELGIVFARYPHPPVATVEEAAVHWKGMDATHFKNLFLRNQKGDRHYLLVVEHAKRVDLRAIAEKMGDGKLSFASPQRLLAHLGLTPGSVSPFGLINDHPRAVRVFLDADIKTATRVSFHPNINTATLVISGGDFFRFLEACGNPVRYVTI